MNSKLIILSILLILLFSCTKSNKQEKKTKTIVDTNISTKAEDDIDNFPPNQPFYHKPYNLNSFYVIKINANQFDLINRTGTIKLTSQQSKLLKNKYKILKMTTQSVPNGWFEAHWFKKDTVIVHKYSVDNYDDLMDNKIKNSVNIKENNDYKNVDVYVGLFGNFYIDGKLITEKQIIDEINKISNQYGKNSFDFRFLYSPMEEGKLKKTTSKKVKRIKKFKKKLQEA